MECRNDIRHNIDAVECLIRSNFVVIPQYDAHLSHTLDAVISSGLSLTTGPTTAGGNSSQPTPAGQPLAPAPQATAGATPAAAGVGANAPSAPSTTTTPTTTTPVGITGSMLASTNQTGSAVSPGSHGNAAPAIAAPISSSSAATSSSVVQGAQLQHNTQPGLSQMHQNFATVSFAMQVVIRSLNIKTPPGELEFYNTVDALVRIHLSRLPNMPEGLVFRIYL